MQHTQGEEIMEVDVTLEMMDLNRIYKNELDNLNVKKENTLRHLVGFMERFVEAYNQVEEVENKLQRLRMKTNGYVDGLNNKGDEE